MQDKGADILPSLDEEKITVTNPLIRSLDVPGTLTILKNHSPLNSLGGETFFWCYNPEKQLDSNLYSVGTDDSGFFIVFPTEANKKHLMDRKYHALVKPNSNTAVEVAIPEDSPDSVVTYSEYLFIRPQDWESVGKCKSIEEANQKMVAKGLSRDQIEKEAITKLEELTRMRKEITSALLSRECPVVTDEKIWVEFYGKFVYITSPESLDKYPLTEDLRKKLDLHRRAIELINNGNAHSISLLGFTAIPVATSHNFAKTQELLQFIQSHAKIEKL